MTVTVHIYPNDRLFLEVPDDVEEVLADNNQQLSHEEFEDALQRLAHLYNVSSIINRCVIQRTPLV